MRRGVICAALLLVVLAACAERCPAQNPSDIDMQVRLVREGHVFHPGEMIELEITYTSSNPENYAAMLGGYGARMITPIVSPEDGVIDLSKLFVTFRAGCGGMILSAIGNLAEPHTETVELTERLRFDKPGHYRVTVNSNEVSRAHVEQGADAGPLTLSAGPVDLEIGERDAVWEAQELAAIELEIQIAESAEAKARALRRLELLDTEESVRRLLQVYLSGQEETPEWEIAKALQLSRQTTPIVDDLETAVKDPTVTAPSGLPELLATLETRQKLGPFPPYPSGGEVNADWIEKRGKWFTEYQETLERIQDLLLATAEQKAGPQRVATLYGAWEYQHEQHPPGEPFEPAYDRLLLRLLAAQDELTTEQKIEFVMTEWPEMDHHVLRQMVADVSQKSLEPGGSPQPGIIEQWCNDWPEECSPAVLAATLRPGSTAKADLILALPHSSNPALDGRLMEWLRSSPAGDDDEAERMTALVLRVGSPSLAADVKNSYEKLAHGESPQCTAAGFLLTYLARETPEYAQQQLEKELQDIHSKCATDLVNTMHAQKGLGGMDSVLVRALDSPNLEAAKSVVDVFRDAGNPKVRPELWQRLEKLWSDWGERKDELEHPKSGSGDAAEGTAALEQTLAMAIVYSDQWTTGMDELQRMRSRCLTEACRSVAEQRAKASVEETPDQPGEPFLR